MCERAGQRVGGADLDHVFLRGSGGVRYPGGLEGNVTIIRDTWGIAHVYGKTDAHTVFGLLYAQAEDDFNRIELNYINAMGRLAEVEGEKELWRDLRMKLFIDTLDLETVEVSQGTADISGSSLFTVTTCVLNASRI